MAEQNDKGGFLDAAAAAFLRRRLHKRRMRAAAVRALKHVSAGVGGGVQMDFDHAAKAFAHLGSWMASYAGELPAALAALPDAAGVPPLTVVIMIVGSRGDVQPFIPIARRLVADGHRVRLATHSEFRDMVEGAGLEFYPLAGDPHQLVEYMVKTGGRIIPLRLGQIVEDVPKKRAMIAEILASTWRACSEPDAQRQNAAPFHPDLIIANPPSYGHIHCAEALHIPLHMIFTMPWSATSAFPHPLARLDPAADRPVQNFLSYMVADLLAWGGIGDLVNTFREESLQLPPIERGDGAALLDDHEVPFTYLWPPSLVPKPADWGPHIDLANFVFYDQADTFEPPHELSAFLAAGEAPIYVGFGSAVPEDSAEVVQTILAAFEKAAVRGIVSKGWAKLEAEQTPPNVFLIGDVPHDWLFARCSAVCHHGGAGTTAAGLRAGLPTIVVPFFGDQFFWGQVIAGAGAGPDPIPIDRLDSDSLAAAFGFCAREPVRAQAQALGAKVRETDGVELVRQSLYRHLPLSAMRCACDPSHLATVYCDTCRLRLCQACCRAHHVGHPVHPYGYVDWGVRPARGLAAEVMELIGDAARALQAGLEEILPNTAPERRGVVFYDTDPPATDDPHGPARKPRR